VEVDCDYGHIYCRLEIKHFVLATQNRADYLKPRRRREEERGGGRRRREEEGRGGKRREEGGRRRRIIYIYIYIYSYFSSGGQQQWSNVQHKRK
jgi:hypothetical protein